MFDIKTQDTCLFLDFSPESTIAQVEADTDKIKALLQKMEGVQKVVLNAGRLERLDTAYLQLLLSFSETVSAMDVQLIVEPDSEELQALLSAYGFNKDALNRS